MLPTALNRYKLFTSQINKNTNGQQDATKTDSKVHEPPSILHKATIQTQDVGPCVALISKSFTKEEK